ncbi:Gfo/Idh/MocA family oxidoreductase [Siminovitchia sp. FSL H7-0308]|uniref:Dehydrogenase n=1 Tax=Siminovitchia thermophila TaxID=1245522 RepID=A0ABS2RCA0_9BACI|nr:Gfo/Idh/MocA family oxidoreductase [Siminovitchia thermophila]MBM7717276.1 putative dehydrogenase [Siminovitchia thermophila]
MVRIAVIGTGAFGVEHIRTIRSMNGVELFGICNRSEERLMIVAKEYGISSEKTYTDVTKLLQEKALDAVVIATDEQSHEPIARQAVEYGKHVLIEKPISTQVETAEQLLKLAKTSDSIILPGHMLRFDPGYAAVKNKLETITGPIHSVRFKRNVPFERFSLHARTHPVFMALSHDIDQLVWYTNSKPKRFFAMEKKIVSDIDMPGIFFGFIEMEDGMICSLETQWCLPNEYGQYLDVELEMMYDGGHIRYRFPGDTLSVIDHGKMMRPDIQLSPFIHGHVYGALRNELEHFVELIKNKSTRQVVPMEEAVLGIKICDALITSAKERRAISWENV